MEDSRGEPVQWWKTAVCYEVYPASFKDSNGDGIGDIPGLISKLDYLHDLGIDVVWLCPMYASPQVDMGYDISNYEDVHPPYGTVKDVEDLIQGLHDRGMRLILDLVINHTSDLHAWFLESKSNRTNPKSDWYIWRGPKVVDGKKYPPNNWQAIWGGSAWEYVAERDQYYLHGFEKEMPDLNWPSPTARKAIRDSALRFWLEKGVDGFRVDVASGYCKEAAFLSVDPDEIPSETGTAAVFSYSQGPRMHEYYQELREKVLDDFGDPMLVGEMAFLSREDILKYVTDAREFSMLFDFGLFMLGRETWEIRECLPFTLPEFKAALKNSQDLVSYPGAWTSIWGENHDGSRSVSKFATDKPEFRERAAKLLAMLFCTCSGTLFVYQGQELGMCNIPETWTQADLKDVASLSHIAAAQTKYPNDTEKQKAAFNNIRTVGRDNARTPMQWDSSPHAGFTSATPWMRVHDNYTHVNAETELSDQNSVLKFWTQCIALRKKHHDVFTLGIFEIEDFDNLDTFTFVKTAPNGKKALVVLNMSETESEMVTATSFEGKGLKLLISNCENQGQKLGPWEGRVYLVD